MEMLLFRVSLKKKKKSRVNCKYAEVKMKATLKLSQLLLSEHHECTAGLLLH